MTDAAAPLPLRVRKRLAAMHRIQTVALDMFDAEGFDKVTVEQIAEAAEVSASSVYRYFGTKERIVIWDEFDDQAMAHMAGLLSLESPLAAIRQALLVAAGPALMADQERVHRRVRLAFTTPSIEAAAVQEVYAVAQVIARLLTDQGSLDDLHAKVYAHGFVGALLGALRHWHDSGFETPMQDVIATVLDVVEDRGPADLTARTGGEPGG